MNTSQIRQFLGFTWFYALAFITATVIIATDADIGSLTNALLRPNLPTVIVVSLLVVVVAAPSLLCFRRRQWGRGSMFALIAAIVAWGVMLVLQTTASPLTIQAAISLLPRVALAMGGWTILVALPAALLMYQD